MEVVRHMDMGGGSSGEMSSAMHMASSTMSMASSTMSMAMDMASSTMSMAMASSTSSHAHGSSSSSSSGMDMGGMSMNMYLTTKYKDYPVLFSGLSAHNRGQAFGIFVLMFFVSFLSKGFEFLKNYLEQKVWKNPNYAVTQVTNVVEECACDDDKDSNPHNDVESLGASNQRNVSVPLVLMRDVIRLVLCFIPELLSYAMMLVAMSFSLVYFFAVVTGMAFGRFFFERLSDTIGVRPGANNFQGHH
ncbi:putative copper transport protein [Clavispora lusitaniae]|uniref:Copper transport protein n=1 Tax=Clavispora lusitaniae TaxID=36911 RepID=A0ACD0WLP7_CLALS|nr:putative copper transport protein [Clavispora lusitaniae]QFZ34122.1 putative copper transport protein [Clavispora lusitaniae]QFZ39806.1 putative copper transport protein [Clavispora lusitaniae]QFZ45488.1 putative copper transport protein [Clavispora lusitaniae]QFZ51152.1 putative copper transport protein [Clavispora lusitaniae]